MQILTKILTYFKTENEIFIYGPNEIPKKHALSGKKLYRHGCYTRKLKLSNGIQVVFVIFRFFEKVNGKYITYSLLPFYISSYQRHINTSIDRVLQLYFVEQKSLFSISEDLDIGLTTIRRWISKFSDKAGVIDNETEKMMIESEPGYRAASYQVKNIFEVVRSIFKKVSILAKNKKVLFEFGMISWINLKIRI
jgi:transposase-like protein